MVIKLPVVTEEIENTHAGEQAAIVDGEFVAFGKTYQEVLAKAMELGYDHEDILLAAIARPGVYRA